MLAAEFGLTSARWQVLGAIVYAKRPLTAPQIARRMGLTRQSVHTTLNHLLGDGIVEQVENADHRRSPLVRLTERGETAYRAIDDKQAAWVNDLAAGLSHAELETAARVLDELSRRLEAAHSHPDEPEGDAR